MFPCLTFDAILAPLIDPQQSNLIKRPGKTLSPREGIINSLICPAHKGIVGRIGNAWRRFPQGETRSGDRRRAEEIHAEWLADGVGGLSLTPIGGCRQVVLFGRRDRLHQP